MEKRLASLKLENIRSQMNPHFVFNSLNSIQDFILSNERDLASSYLVKFSRLIRMYLEYSQQHEISLNQEIHALKLYLDLEKMRFDDELEYTITMDSALDADLFKVPSLFVQPYVENALKHGLLHKKKNRQLSIKCTLLKNEHLVEIIVEDNGIGRLKSAVLNKMRKGTHRSFATAVNDQRVQLFKERFNKQVNITIKDLHNAGGEATGTRVILIFPLN
jgi:LytS/YehU family sensor histidine kinase